MKKIAMTFFVCMLPAILLSGCSTSKSSNQAQNEPQSTVEEVTQDRAAQDHTSDEIAQTESEEQTSSPQVVFEAQDMDGNAVSSEIFANAKITMVNVWATYCNPCLSEMPGLGELMGEYAPEDFQLIGIISDVMEGGEEAQMEYAASLIEQTGADYTHLLLNRSLYIGLLTGVNAVPTTFFIDENGTVLDTVIGAMDKSAWEEKINGFLEK